MEWLWELVQLYLIVAALGVGLTHLLYFYEVANGPGLDWLRRQTGPPIFLLLLRNVVFAYLTQLMVVIFYLPGLVRPFWFPKKARDPEAPAVVLVHGLYHNASAWVLFRQRLRDSGFSNIYAVSYWSFNAEFFDVAARLEQRIDEALNQCPGQGVYLVGHSLGGLLTRHYVANGTRRKEVLAAVTLGAPHKGSRLAALGLGKLARSLIYRGALANRLRELDVAPKAPCLSLSSCMDEFVTPPDALRLDLAGWEERRTACRPHVSMLYSGKVACDAIAFLKQHAGRTP